jgi:hypothetical protein
VDLLSVNLKSMLHPTERQTTTPNGPMEDWKEESMPPKACGTKATCRYADCRASASQHSNGRLQAAEAANQYHSIGDDVPTGVFDFEERKRK